MLQYSDWLRQDTSRESKEETLDRRLFSVDLIRAYAIFMVVMVHAAAPVMLSFSSISQSSWWVANILFSFAHQGVPLFIMISGLLLLDPNKNETLARFFRKRVVKVVWPLLFWSAFYYFWRVLYKGESLTASKAFLIVIQGQIYYHLWFIYLILGLYIATPVLRFYIKSAPKINILYFVVVWAIFISLLPVLRHFTGISIGIDNVLFHSLIGYFLIGPLMNQLSFQNRYTWIIILGIISVTLLTAVGTHLFTLRFDGQYQGQLLRLHMPNIIALSVGTFLMLMKWQHSDIFKSELIAAFVQRISLASFGIYLLHPAILDLLDAGCFGFSLSAIRFHPVIGIPLTVIVTITLSFLVVTALKRIPLLKSVVP